MYGGIYAGPALSENEDVPVVRYQDLHRTHAPASAGAPELADFGSAREDAEYGTPFTFTERDDNRYAYRVDLDSAPPTVEITKAPMGRYTGPVTNASDPEAYASIIRLATEEASTQRGRVASRDEKKDDDDGFDWSALVSAVGEGVSRGVKKDRAETSFQPSGRSQRPVFNQPPAQQAKTPDTLKYVLIGGGVLLGAGILAAAISSASRARATE